MSPEEKTAVDRPIQLSSPAIPSAEEAERLWNIGTRLARSGVYKDVRQAEQAYAKLIIGHELGLNISQSMSIHFVQGQVTIPYPLLALFVKRNGYRFEYISLEDEKVEIEFFDPDGQSIGISSFTKADAERAGLAEKDTNQKYPRNKLVARAMSNGVRWFVQEATGGLPVYTWDEIPETPEITEGEGSGEMPSFVLPPQAAEIVRHALELGHSGYSDAAAVALVLGGQSQEFVDRWVAKAEDDLSRHATRKTLETPTSPSDEPSDMDYRGRLADVEVELEGPMSDERRDILESERDFIRLELSKPIAGQEAMDV